MTSREAQAAWPGGSVAGKVEEGDPQEGDPQAAGQEAIGRLPLLPGWRLESVLGPCLAHRLSHVRHFISTC